MKRTLYCFGITLSSFIMISCYTQKPLTKGTSDNNETYKVEYLFEHDGCKVYRFHDRGSYIYFTNCTGNVTAISNDSIQESRFTITNHR